MRLAPIAPVLNGRFIVPPDDLRRPRPTPPPRAPRPMLTMLLHSPLVPVALVAWVLTVDGPSANAIALALVAAYFEYRRQVDLRRSRAEAAKIALPIAQATARLEVKSAIDASRIDDNTARIELNASRVDSRPSPPRD